MIALSDLAHGKILEQPCICGGGDTYVAAPQRCCRAGDRDKPRGFQPRTFDDPHDTGILSWTISISRDEHEKRWRAYFDGLAANGLKRQARKLDPRVPGASLVLPC